MKDKKILVLVDGSEAALRAVQAARGLARATGRKLRLLHVHPDSAHQVPGLEVLGRKELRKLREESARKVFDEARAALGQDAAGVEEVLLWGDPAEEIIDYTRSEPDCHLVMGRRGLGRLGSLLLGSVSDKVVRHARGLVTVVD